jgi:hypothetical protein
LKANSVARPVSDWNGHRTVAESSCDFLLHASVLQISASACVLFFLWTGSRSPATLAAITWWRLITSEDNVRRAIKGNEICEAPFGCLGSHPGQKQFQARKQWITQTNPGFDPDGKRSGFLPSHRGSGNFEPDRFCFYFRLKRTAECRIQNWIIFPAGKRSGTAGSARNERGLRLTVIQWHCGSLCAFLVSTRLGTGHMQHVVELKEKEKEIR